MTEPLSLDTSREVARMQAEGWRRMDATQKAAIISGLTQAVRDIAMAGVRHRYPNAAPHEHFLRLALIMLGEELARKVYPEIDAMDLR